MLFADGVLGLALLGLWVFCILDVVTTDAALVRNLPKLLWLLIVLLLPDIGSIVWLVAGHPWGGRSADLPYKGNRGRPGYSPGFPETDRARWAPRRGGAPPLGPDDDEEFQRRLRARAEEQRRRARGEDGSPEPR